MTGHPDHGLERGALAPLHSIGPCQPSGGGLTGVTPSPPALAQWIICRELGGVERSVSGAEAAERACRKLGQYLALLVTPVGAEALLSRAKHVVRTDFLFVDHQPIAGVEALTPRPRERTNGVQSGQIQDESSAVLTALIALVVTFIGEDLTTRLVRDVWPELPQHEPTRQSSNGHVEATP